MLRRQIGVGNGRIVVYVRKHSQRCRVDQEMVFTEDVEHAGALTKGQSAFDAVVNRAMTALGTSTIFLWS